MISFELLLADVGEIIGVVVVVFFIAVTIIGNIVAKINEQQAKARRAGGGQQPRPQRQGGGGGGLGDEIAQFLRRAAGQAEPPPEPEHPVAQLVEAEPVPEPARRVGEGLDTSTFDSRADRLGSDVANEGRRFDQRIQDSFDHDLTSLSASGEGAKPSKRRGKVPPAAAAGLAAMLANTDNIRQAIVITEIINRPRWE